MFPLRGKCKSCKNEASCDVPTRICGMCVRMCESCEILTQPDIQHWLGQAQTGRPAGQAAWDIVRVDMPRARCPVWDSQIWRTFVASSPELTEDLRLYLMNIKSLDYRNETLRTWADIKWKLSLILLNEPQDDFATIMRHSLGNINRNIFGYFHMWSEVILV